MVSLSLGVEVEILVRPKFSEDLIKALFTARQWNFEQVLTLKERLANNQVIRNVLVEHLEKESVPAHTIRRDYTKWIMDKDGSILEPENEAKLKPFYGIEMISRVQRDLKSSMEEIEVVWSTLQEFCEIQMHESCSTHVHIGADDGWSLEELKSISKGWLWFEQSIRAAMPSSRKDCDWAAPNPSHEYEARFKSARKMVILYEKALAEDSFSRVFSFVDRADSIDNLIERVAPERCLSWNYQNTRNKCQTIEFRRPPLSRDASDCKHWVVFALSVVQWALTADFTKEKYLENTYEFEATLRAMAEKLGISKHLKEFGDMEDLELASMSNFDALKIMKKKAERQDLGQRD